MPTYQYACTECGHQLEAVQSFSDDALTVCPECAGKLRKLFGAVGVVFKGSGFYRTDSRGSSSSSSPASPAPKQPAKKDTPAPAASASTS
ncbi:FmdB family zinc ribbon protein [Longispora albida]|uniref:FmdB family zinc ribbon protein n=1 Tax=Longispora albida TaxID=203523 RepID=UPI00035F1809|nr:FmdB family zinc ribbon protein [Longispora albida]